MRVIKTTLDRDGLTQVLLQDTNGVLTLVRRNGRYVSITHGQSYHEAPDGALFISRREENVGARTYRNLSSAMEAMRTCQANYPKFKKEWDRVKP